MLFVGWDWASEGHAITVLDAQGRQTRVTLTGLKPVANLDPSLFVMRDTTPRSGEPSRESSHRPS